ncbi:DUF736 domain-containing protein [Ochrobactrum sp. A-1]|uniref:DUF736 domain-containing protein n=1 Tax=Ochrobactrum sp. A-1 TaxID=2920940 RepID=UPI001F0ADB70|nr:DUF736 domain-containing protein [Ochrobactrum sp. A-1]
MADIGSFTRTETGFTGRVEALGIDAPLTFVPAKSSDAENAPAYRILLGGEDGRDIGAGWSHVGEKAGEFVSVEIYSPLFGWLRANLFRDGDDDTAWSLHTNDQRTKRSEGTDK